MATAEAPRASTESSRPAESVTIVPRPVRSRRSVPTAPLYLAPALVVYALFVLWPIVRVLWLSLFRWDGYGPQVFIGLSNFSDLWGDAPFRAALSHSLVWEAAAAVIPTLLALGIAL